MKRHNFPGHRSVALLLDPDKISGAKLGEIITLAIENRVDYIMTGGSLTFNSTDDLIRMIKSLCPIPVILFPGNLLQLSREADAVLLLSLISGRNPELLIGNHVIAAPYLKNMREKLVSVGYILIGSGSKTSVEYISQTTAIPPDKSDIIVATALAGEMLGLDMIYLEGGSGAPQPVPPGIIKAVKDEIFIPLAVGGGLRSREDIYNAFMAGANLVIVGNGCEENPGLLAEACSARDQVISENELPE